MATTKQSTPVTRREIVRSAAAASVAAPFGFAPRVIGAQEPVIDYRSHPAAGVWIETGGGYDVFHADGTYQYFGLWEASTLGLGDPNLAVLGFGVWQPTSERAVDALLRIAWLDTSVTSLLTYRVRLTVASQSDTDATLRYKARVVDASGTETARAQGTDMVTRMQLEPFDDPWPSEATPES